MAIDKQTQKTTKNKEMMKHVQQEKTVLQLCWTNSLTSDNPSCLGLRIDIMGEKREKTTISYVQLKTNFFTT